MGYSREQCEKLGMLADDNGKVLYKDMQRAFPDASPSFFYNLIGDSFKLKTGLFDSRLLTTQSFNPMLFWDQCPEDYRDGYEFKPDDTFHLSVPGANIRYEVKKAEAQEKLTIDTLRWAKISALLALIGILITIWQIVKG